MAQEVRDLPTQLHELRRKLRESHRLRGRAETALHLTRLERDAARAQLRAAQQAVEEQAQYGRGVYYRLRELFEVTRPGMEHGELDDDYKAAIGSIRRMRAIVIELESQIPEAVDP